MNNAVLDVLIPFIVATKEEKAISSNDGIVPQMGGTKYLLGQMIRQLCFSRNHYFISKEAKELWEKISSKDIFDYNYRMPVLCENENNVIIKCFKNNSKCYKERTVKQKDFFVYRDVFHDEHMTPVNDIIERLLSLEVPNYENISEILNSIYICKMLKTEDRGLYPKFHRPFILENIVKEVYSPANIELISL